MSVKNVEKFKLGALKNKKPWGEEWPKEGKKQTRKRGEKRRKKQEKKRDKSRKRREKKAPEGRTNEFNRKSERGARSREVSPRRGRGTDQDGW